MKWGSAWKVLQISDCKGEIAKPKPFIQGMLETINQLYLYIESLIIKNFSRSRQRPQSYIGDATGVQWYDVSFQLNPGKVEIVVFIHNLKKYDAHHVPLELIKIRGEINCIANDTWRRKKRFFSKPPLQGLLPAYVKGL